MLDLSDQVVFTGYRQDAVALMKHFDVLVLPSRTEALGGVLIEAMALGVPIVASSVGGIPEVVKDGETGLLIESSNPEDYAAAILRVLNDPPLAKRITVSAKAWGAQFDIQRIIGLLERCYEEVIGHYKQPALSEPCVRRER
jgi:glycosyltransferase involved in cell wall biosynthesis